jgi:mRNA interferase MazF
VVIRRGDIWWADLRSPIGSEPGYRHPVIIVQSDKLNVSALKTTVALVITSSLRLGALPGNVTLSRVQSGLPKPSVISVTQIVTLDKSALRDRVKTLSAATMERVEDGMRLVLELAAR